MPPYVEICIVTCSLEFLKCWAPMAIQYQIKPFWHWMFFLALWLVHACISTAVVHQQAPASSTAWPVKSSHGPSCQCYPRTQPAAKGPRFPEHGSFQRGLPGWPVAARSSSGHGLDQVCSWAKVLVVFAMYHQRLPVLDLLGQTQESRLPDMCPVWKAMGAKLSRKRPPLGVEPSTTPWPGRAAPKWRPPSWRWPRPTTSSRPRGQPGVSRNLPRHKHLGPVARSKRPWPRNKNHMAKAMYTCLSSLYEDNCTNMWPEQKEISWEVAALLVVPTMASWMIQWLSHTHSLPMAVQNSKLPMAFHDLWPSMVFHKVELLKLLHDV